MADFPSNRPQSGIQQGSKNSSGIHTANIRGRMAGNSDSNIRHEPKYSTKHQNQVHDRPSQASPHPNKRPSLSSSSSSNKKLKSEIISKVPSISHTSRTFSSSGNSMKATTNINSKPMKPHLIQVVSEKPLVIKIRKYSTIPRSKGLPILSPLAGYAHTKGRKDETTTRSGRRVQSKRPNYDFDTDDSEEVEFDDSSIQMHSLDAASGFLSKKGARSANMKKRNYDGFGVANGNTSNALSQNQLNQSSNTTETLHNPANAALPLSNQLANIEAPPPGIIPSLWYSRECCLHIFVIEKILSWKKRHKVVKDTNISHVVPSQNENTTPPELMEYNKISERVLTHLSATRKARKRMEVSRINPSQCPIVLTAMTTTSSSDSPSLPFKEKYKISQDEMEDVILIKWRGHSYIHCSWERPSDLIRFDPTNNTAKQKIKRFYASQETILGMNWKSVLEEGRKITSTNSTTGAASDDPAASKTTTDEDEEEEESFPQEFTYTDVERILACDENEMDMEVFNKQSKINHKTETKLLHERATTGQHHNIGTAGEKPILLMEEKPWDPEDNVRYVVKWKGMQISDATWEYWKDLKYDFVQDVVDFWHRQRAPSMEQVKKAIVKTHPLVKDFKKLQVSPLFGVKCNETRLTEADEDEDQQNALRLRGYQLEGVNWLLWNWFNKRSCILADEMGLGKTIQSVGLLDQLTKLEATQVRGPFLVVAPLSLICQWQSESKAWAPGLNVIVYHGSADARDFMVKQEFYFNENFVGKSTHTKLKKMNWTKFHVLITTFEVVLKDIAVLSKIRWRCLVVDEAHRLKNPKSRLFEELATVPRDFCLLLTGTPLQNSTEELWALLYFADPIGFASKETFIEKFGQLTDSKQVRDLHGILKPYLLRRVKEDVEKSLPPKEETILEVSLTPIQKTYYKAIYEKNTSFLFKGSKPSNAPSLMNIMMELRKCCNHPFLIRGAEERILADAAAVKSAEKKQGEETQAYPANTLELMAENLITSSGKMVLLSKLLPKLYDGGHKVLIFSQMVKVLDLLEELLRNKKYRYERLDGSTSASSRNAAVDRFCRRSYQRFVMLLSTRAGGLGLNLTAADTVIIFDSDWNPQNDLQAMARAHRIGQTRAVRVYRLLTSKTYEMHMFHSASMKLGLDRAVLAHQRHNDALVGENADTLANPKSKMKREKEIQAKEIDQLLKKGAYDVFRDDDDDKESKQFMETDIDSLLERSSRKVTYDNTAETSISSGLGSFSKASFVASAGDDIDLDDPDFWKKAVGFEAPPEGSGTDQKLFADNIEGKKRSRKQVQVFDPYAAFAEAEQRKQDKMIAKAKEEKEEKERLRKEKKLKKQKEKDKRKREREEAKEAKGKLLAFNTDQKKQKIDEERSSSKDKKSNKEGKQKKQKKNERTKRLRQILNKDPLLERLKQAWEAPQRNRAINAALGFGLGRLCKVRQESFLTSLPIQDLEVFLRGYLYQVGLQAGVGLLNRIRDPKEYNELNIKKNALNLLNDLVQTYGIADGQWICEAIRSALKLHGDVRARKRTLRLPFTLTETLFVKDLREGAATRALRRFAFLSRLTKLIDNALNRVLAELGHEELGKRGCSTKDLSTLDVDMKARHVTTEELTHSLGMDFDLKCIDSKSSSSFPGLAPWWDRSCDVALIIGTFIHGLGNYKSMQEDEDLPFGFKISRYAIVDMFSLHAYQNFDAAFKAMRILYSKTLAVSSKSDDEMTSNKQEKNLQNKQNSPEEKIDAVQIKDGQQNSSSVVDKITVNEDKAPKNSISLMKISTKMVESIRATSQSFKKGIEKSKKQYLMKTKKNVALAGTVAKNGKSVGGGGNKLLLPWNHRLPMPVSIKLDRHLIWLIDNIEKNKSPSELQSSMQDAKPPTHQAVSNPSQFSVLISRNNDILIEVLKEFHGDFTLKLNKCQGFRKAKYDDNSERLISSEDIIKANPSNSERDVGVPAVLTKYSFCGLVFADESVMQSLISRIKAANHKNIDKDIISPDPVPSYASEQEKESTSSIFRDVILSYLQNNDIRAKICVSILQYGSPFFREEKSFFKVHTSAWSSLYGDDDCDEDSTSDRLFFDTQALVYTSKISLGADKAKWAKYFEMIENYINSTLLPYCLSLCLQGVKPLNENELHQAQQNYAQDQSVLPDPYLSPHEHSEDAVKIASAILRRTRLMKAIRYILGGGVPWALLSSFLRSPAMRKNLVGLPIWWCPWIHDLALLVYAATFGLFAVIIDKAQNKERFIHHKVFGTEAIETHIRTIFLEGRDGLRPALPHTVLEAATNEEKETWLQLHAKQFPNVHVIEKRLAYISSELTTTAAAMNVRYKTAEWRFVNFPMFDHDELGNISTFSDRSGTTQMNKCLLRAVEDDANDDTINT